MMGTWYLFWDNGKEKRDLRSSFFSYSKFFLNWFPVYNIVGKTLLTIPLGKWTRMTNYSFSCEELNHSVPERSSLWTYKQVKGQIGGSSAQVLGYLHL